MDITITFRDGPIEAELEATGEDDFEEALQKLAEFIDGYEPSGESEFNEEETESEDEVVEYNSQENLESYAENSDDDPEADDSNPILTNTDANEREIHRILKFGEEKDGSLKYFPRIIGNVDVLADSNQRKILHGAVVILTLIDDIHNIDRVKTSELKEALENSGINTDNWNNAVSRDDGEVYLDRRGQGRSATVAVRQPGKIDAYELITDLVDDLRADHSKK